AVIGGRGVLVGLAFGRAGNGRRGNGRRIVDAFDGDVDGDVVAERAIADADHEAVAADVIGVRRVGDRLAVAGAACYGRAVAGCRGYGPGQRGAIGIGGIQCQGERGRVAVFRHADVDAVTFGNHRRIVFRRDIDGEVLRIAQVTVADLQLHVGRPRIGAVFRRRPLHQATCGNG